MSPGDRVRVDHEGRAYLAVIEMISTRCAYVRFTSKVPPTSWGKRPRTRSIPRDDLVAYGKGGISYRVRGA